MAAWTIPALDQSQFDSLAIQFKNTSQVDEIRFGACYEDVIGMGTPAEPVYIIATYGSLAGTTKKFYNDDGTLVPPTGYTLDYAYESNKIALVQAGGGYQDWADANLAVGALIDGDFNGDGVENGIAYFYADTGVITLPSVVNGAVTWTNGGNTSDYGPAGEYVIQTSTNFQNWTDVTVGALDTNDSPGDLTYTLPTSAIRGQRFS